MNKPQSLVCVIFTVSLLEGKHLDFLGSEKTVVDIKDYNFYAVIAPVGRYEAYCGSTLISPLFLISAYHCIKFTAPEAKWQAHFEVENKCEPPSGWTVNVTRVYFHGKAAADPKNIKDDLVLMKLLREVTNIPPAILPRVGPSPGEVGVVIGYEARRPRPQSREGFLKEWTSGSRPGQQSCPLLKKMQMIQMKDACDVTGSQNETDGLYCSYNPPESFSDCRFDSGAPWFHETRPGYRLLIGVSTFGDFYCNPQGINGLYTDVYAYRNWIQNVMRGNIGADVRVISYDDDEDDDDEDDDDEDDDDEDDDDEDDDDEDDDDEDDDDEDDGDEDDNDEIDNEEEDDSEEYDFEEEVDSEEYNSEYEGGIDEQDDESYHSDEMEERDEDDYENEEEDGSSDESEDEHEPDSDDNDDDDDDDVDYDDDDDDDDDDYTNEWVPSGSPYVVGPPFTT